MLDKATSALQHMHTNGEYVQEILVYVCAVDDWCTEPEARGRGRQSGKFGPEKKNLQCLILKNKKESKTRWNGTQSKLYYLEKFFKT